MSRDWRLGVSPLSWTNDVLEDMGGEIPLDTCLAEAAAAGYAGIELGRKFPRKSVDLKPLLDRHDLKLVSGWHSGQLAERGVEDEMAAVASHAELLREMGCEVMVYGETAMMASLDAPMTARRLMPEDEVAGYAARLTEVAAWLMGEYGLRLAYHHHLMMVAETFDETARLMEVAGPEVGLLLDTGHAVAAGFDYTRLIELFGDRIAHVHLKDVRPDVMAHVRDKELSFNEGVRHGMFTVPGDGAVDFGPAMRFLSSGYDGWAVVEAEQDPALAPPRAAVARAHIHLDTLIERAVG